ncbi:MAG TPA: CoA pyrophosphatase [Gemmatimonadaceae bacterium]|nr:CoA pyrophosphatase [Gemmatimonadaceae bacterium]
MSDGREGARFERLLANPTVQKIRVALAARGAVPVPDEEGVRRAAVALIFRLAEDDDAVELLLIKRAEYPGDPWSGQIAFPGGREESGDPSLSATAVRETREETGIDLGRDGMILGVLDDLRPQRVRLPAIVVRPFVAILDAREALELSAEVALAFWVPFGEIAKSDSWQSDTVFARGVQINARVFRHHDHIVWGMTERIMTQLLTLIEE